MNFHQPLVIHKSVWEKLKRQTDPPKEPVKHNEKYLKKIIEKSQVWIKTWPDSVEGHMRKLREERKKQHEKDLALLRERKRDKIKISNNEAVKRAKKMIFYDSCHGKQLISDLIESKTLEERDAQVLFKNKIKQEAIDHEKFTNKPSLYCTFDLDKNYEIFEEQNKTTALKCTNENKWKQQRKEREAKNHLKLQKEELKILEFNEKQKEEEITKAYQKSLNDYEINQEKIKEDRKKQRELDDALVKVYAKEQDRRKCKIQQVYNQIHKDKQETAQYKLVYKIIEDCQETQQKRYQFIDDRIKSMEHQYLKKDNGNEEKAKRKGKDLHAISQFNKNNQQKSECSQTSVCDRQCLIPATCKIRTKSINYGNRIRDEDRSKLNFLKPRNKLVDELKKRGKEASAWSGTNATHEQFATAAD